MCYADDAGGKRAARRWCSDGLCSCLLMYRACSATSGSDHTYTPSFCLLLLQFLCPIVLPPIIPFPCPMYTPHRVPHLFRHVCTVSQRARVRLTVVQKNEFLQLQWSRFADLSTTFRAHCTALLTNARSPPFHRPSTVIALRRSDGCLHPQFVGRHSPHLRTHTPIHANYTPLLASGAFVGPRHVRKIHH